VIGVCNEYANTSNMPSHLGGAWDHVWCLNVAFIDVFRIIPTAPLSIDDACSVFISNLLSMIFFFFFFLLFHSLLSRLFLQILNATLLFVFPLNHVHVFLLQFIIFEIIYKIRIFSISSSFNVFIIQIWFLFF